MSDYARGISTGVREGAEVRPKNGAQGVEGAWVSTGISGQPHSWMAKECKTLTSRVGWDGYPRLSVCGKRMAASRATWIRVNGPIPSGMCVCHRCDNRRCVEIAHLFLGTQAENMRDRDLKGRGLSTMTESLAEDIRAMYAGGVSRSRIATIVGHRYLTVWNICANKTWVRVN